MEVKETWKLEKMTEGNNKQVGGRNFNLYTEKQNKYIANI